MTGRVTSLASRIPRATGTCGRTVERIIHVTDATLQTWHAILEDDSVPVRQTRMVYTVNTAAADVLATLARQPGGLSWTWSSRLAGTSPPTVGRATSSPGGALLESWDDVILQGPHLYVATPMYKSVNPTMKHQQDWSATDFEALSADAIPVTAYKPTGNRARYDAGYTQWESGPARSSIQSCLASHGGEHGGADADCRADPAGRGSPAWRSFCSGRLRAAANPCA